MEREKPGKSHHVLCRVLRPIIVGLCSVLGPICTTMTVYILFNILNILNAHVWEHWNLESTRNGCQC